MGAIFPRYCVDCAIPGKELLLSSSGAWGQCRIYRLPTRWRPLGAFVTQPADHQSIYPVMSAIACAPFLRSGPGATMHWRNFLPRALNHRQFGVSHGDNH